jgi:hypothetical protein
VWRSQGDPIVRTDTGIEVAPAPAGQESRRQEGVGANQTSRDDGGQRHTNRRLHERLAIRLPVECRRDDNGRTSVVRTITQNVSTGGMYLELDASEFQAGDRILVEMIVPPAEGVSPYQGRASCQAEVLRVGPVTERSPTGLERLGVAARFLDRLRLAY